MLLLSFIFFIMAMGLFRCPWSFIFSGITLFWALAMALGKMAWHPIAFSILISIIVLMIIPFIRRRLLMRPLWSLFLKLQPKISATEAQALNIGDAWIEKDIFQGHITPTTGTHLKPVTLVSREKAFHFK